MPGIGSLIREKELTFDESKTIFASKNRTRALSVNTAYELHSSHKGIHRGYRV